MGQFDLKNAIVSLCDGTLATLTTTAGAGVNAEIVLTDASRHRGTQPKVTITIVNAGVSHLTLDVAVSGTDITVTPITDGGGVITSTALAVGNAINAFPAAAALVTVTQAGTGGSPVVAQVKTPLTGGANHFSVKVAEGVITYSEKKPRKYTKDRGLLSTVMDSDDEPKDIKIDAIWDFITSGTALTFTDCLKKANFASSWLSTDPDQCQPYCVDVEVAYNPNCGVLREFITLQLFRYESLDHELKSGVINCSGKCNTKEAVAYRVT